MYEPTIKRKREEETIANRSRIVLMNNTGYRSVECVEDKRINTHIIIIKKKLKCNNNRGMQLSRRSAAAKQWLESNLRATSPASEATTIRHHSTSLSGAL